MYSGFTICILEPTKGNSLEFTRKSIKLKSEPCGFRCTSYPYVVMGTGQFNFCFLWHKVA